MYKVQSINIYIYIYIYISYIYISYNLMYLYVIYMIILLIFWIHVFFYKHIKFSDEARLCLSYHKIKAGVTLTVCLLQ